MYRILLSYCLLMSLTAAGFCQTGGVNTTCLSTHVYNACGSLGYITFSFNNTTHVGTSTADPLTIQQSNLSVGVNNYNPQARLHVTGGGSTSASSSFLVTNSVNAEAFRVLDNGNIGIGTSNPQTRLAVNGIVSAQKIQVTPTGWPDYVFDKCYYLMPLPELEKYIAANRHLPEMVSADEVKDKGLDLGDNNAALLKKIEELTLYLIRQNKRLEQQELEIQRLKNLIDQH